MTHPVPALLLAVLAIVLAGPGPRLMARFTRFRRTPGPALLAWQSVGLSAVVSALLVGPAVLAGLATGAGRRTGLPGLTDRPLLLTVCLGASGLVLALVLLSGHRVGTGLRTLRHRHRALVDLLAEPAPELPDGITGAVAGPDGAARDDKAATKMGIGTSKPQRKWVRVLTDASPTAYCLPGLQQRLVVSRGALETLAEDELDAVLEHERAHLRARHDLVLEFFSVLHHAVPTPVRCPAALAEVSLLVEALADRAALRATGARPLARALVTMAGGRPPEAALGAGGPAGQVRVRLGLIAAAADPAPALTAVVLGFALVVAAAPWMLFAWAL